MQAPWFCPSPPPPLLAGACPQRLLGGAGPRGVPFVPMQHRMGSVHPLEAVASPQPSAGRAAGKVMMAASTSGPSVSVQTGKQSLACKQGIMERPLR